jgi:DNA (cytosine-5)-methyltransferase 1
MSVTASAAPILDPQRQVSTTIDGKIARLRAGGVPRVIDLFAGCGGISLGFLAAGFRIDGAVELDEDAARTHALNFHRHGGQGAPDGHDEARDITSVDPVELVGALGLEGDVHEGIDVLVGGPPCQAYARVGRAKLREVADHPEAFLQDPRRNLYLRYLDYVREFQPLAVLMENVPDVINQAGHNIAEETCEVLEELGYQAAYTLLNAAFYGVPQMRERMFLLAYRKELHAKVVFPSPTYYIKLPRGYAGSRQVALKSLDLSLFNPNSYYRPAPEPAADLAPAITAREALEDLPPITLHLEGRLRRGARRFDEWTAYKPDFEPSEYARRLREWPGFRTDGGVFDHVIRSLPRDYPLFRVMHPGDQYPQAYGHALELFARRLKALARAGRKLKPKSVEYEALKASIVPPYDPGKFPNKWRKMEPDLPARTLMAHLGKDSYSHIHYDSSQARTISVREAARLQSFPDGFVFSGTMNPALRQIGNAVPPLLAACVAAEIAGTLRRA